LVLANQISDRKNEVQLLINMAMERIELGHGSEAFSLLTRASAIKEGITMTRFRGGILGNLGSACVVMENYPEALDYYHQLWKRIAERAKTRIFQ